MIDLYQTIRTSSEGIYKEKGSKFIAIAFPVFSEEIFKERLVKVKKEHPNARHYCYAFRLGTRIKNYRFNDDGEPSNTAGKPIFGQIESFDLTNVAIIVIRYFGGTKLGVSGLISAYKEAAKSALNNAYIIKKTVDNIYEIQFGYEIMSDVMNFIKQQELLIIKQTLEDTGVIQFQIRQTEAEKIVEQFKKIENLKIKFLKTV